MNLGYLLNDTELAQYGFKSRMLSPRADGVAWPRVFPGTIKPYNSTPQTVPLYKSPAGGKYDLELSDAWEDFIASVNTKRATKFLWSPPAGLRNRNARWDSLGFGGNSVKILGEKNEAYRIEGVDIRKKPPKLPLPSYLLHKFTVTRKDGAVVLPADGILVYVPLLTRGDLWVSKSRVRVA